MNTQQLAPTTPVTLYEPAWALYVYDDRAYITYNGRLVAIETCATATQEASLVAVRDCLNDRIAVHTSSH